MRFELQQRFRAAPDDVARAFADAGFYAALQELPNVDRPEVLDRQEDGERVRLRVRYRFTGALSPAARRVIDPARLTWVEDTTHDLASRTARFVLLPDHYGSRFSCAGGYRFDPDGDGTRRRLEGDLTVRFPLVGRAVERAIVSGLRDHQAHEVGVLERYLAG